MEQIIENSIENMKSGRWDMTVGGKCSQCGKCCANILPLTKTDVARIKKYVKECGIRPITHVTPYAEAGDPICPFRDNEAKKCTIYPVRPAICKDYLCSNAKNGIMPNTALYKGEIHFDDLRKKFFGDEESKRGKGKKGRREK